MQRIKNVKVSSRRSREIKKQYFTMECSLEADVSDLNEKDKKQYVKKMWDYANNEVDNQLLQVQKDLDKG